VARAVKRIYTIRPEAVVRAKDRFYKAMDETDRALEGRPYLSGDAPSRADVTTAALLAPLCRPPEHLVPWPEIPAALAPFMREIEGRPTWNHALKMYREHRRPSPA
jgi:glutathione S-transferase